MEWKEKSRVNSFNFSDADIDKAVEIAHNGLFFNM